MDRTRGHKRLIWHTALSCDGGACVQVAADDAILVRSSADPNGPILAFSPSAWRDLIVSIKQMSLASVPASRGPDSRSTTCSAAHQARAGAGARSTLVRNKNSS